MADKVIVYMADWCPWCHKVMEFLDQNKVKYEARNVDVGNNAEEVEKKSGQSGIPITDIDGQIVLGYDVKKLKELLKLN